MDEQLRRGGGPAAGGTILVTGFSGFPGSPRNPTERIAAAMAREAPRFARLGLLLRCAVLPVLYDGLDARLEALAREHRPDAWLMLGVANRRRQFCVETTACNRAAPTRPDAAGELPRQVLLAGGPAQLPATLPCRRILAALRTAELPARLSRDAGDYLCNAALYAALAASLAPAVGFLHVPPPIAPRSRRSLRRDTLRRGVTDAELMAAARHAVLALAACPTVRKRKLGRSESPASALPRS